MVKFVFSLTTSKTGKSSLGRVEIEYFPEPDSMDNLSPFKQIEISDPSGKSLQSSLSFFAGAVPLDHPFEIGVFPMPALDGEPRLVTYTSGGPAVSALTEHPEEAKLFAVEFSTNVETNADDLFRDAHIPNNKLFDLERDMANYELHPLIFEMIEILQAPGIQHVPFFTFEVGDYALFPGMQSEVFANSQEILSGTETSQIIKNLNS